MMKRKTTALPVALGIALCVGLAPVGAAGADGAPLFELAGTGDGAETPDAPTGPDDAGTTAAQDSGNASASIVRDGAPVAFDSLESAIAAARDGEEIVLTGSFSLSAPLRVADGRSLALRAAGPVSIRRGENFPASGGKPQGLVKLAGASALSLFADEGAELVLDGERIDSDEAVVTVDGSSRLVMGTGAVVANA